MTPKTPVKQYRTKFNLSLSRLRLITRGSVFDEEHLYGTHAISTYQGKTERLYVLPTNNNNHIVDGKQRVGIPVLKDEA